VLVLPEIAVQDTVAFSHPSPEQITDSIVHLLPRLQNDELLPTIGHGWPPCEGEGIGGKQVPLPIMQCVVVNIPSSVGLVQRNIHGCLYYRQHAFGFKELMEDPPMIPNPGERI
jgi:hypothetical protein